MWPIYKVARRLKGNPALAVQIALSEESSVCRNREARDSLSWLHGPGKCSW